MARGPDAFFYGFLDKNLNKTEKTPSKIKADLRIVKVVHFFNNLFAHAGAEELRSS